MILISFLKKEKKILMMKRVLMDSMFFVPIYKYIYLLSRIYTLIYTKSSSSSPFNLPQLLFTIIIKIWKKQSKTKRLKKVNFTSARSARVIIPPRAPLHTLIFVKLISRKNATLSLLSQPTPLPPILISQPARIPARCVYATYFLKRKRKIISILMR